MTLGIIGIVLVVLVVLGAIVSAYYESGDVKNQMKMWKVVANAMGNPAKFLAVGGSLALLIASIIFSVLVGQTMHARMVQVGWIDISEYLVVTMQLVGTVSTYLMPLLLMMMYDTTALKRPDFDAAKAAEYDFWTVKEKPIGTSPARRRPRLSSIGLVISTLLTTAVILYSTYTGGLTTAAANSMLFFLVCASLAIAAIMYCYNAKGATYEEIFAFAMSIVFGAGVYALDFHWNQLLTFEIPLSQLDPNMSSELFAQKVTEFQRNFGNRTFITLMMILMDIFASALGLLSGELVWLMKLMRWISYNSAQQGFTTTTQQVNQQRTVSPVVSPINTTPPPPPPPPPVPPTGGGTNPPPGTTI